MKLLTSLFILIGVSAATSARAQLVWAHQDLYALYNYEARMKNAQRIVRDSLYDYERFVSLDVNTPQWSRYHSLDRNKPKLLSAANALKVLRAANSNPVVATYATSKYDPYDKGIGFCFGRALFVNLYLAINGFDRSNMKKAFVVGPMKSGDGSSWQWHVSTIVQSQDRYGKEIWLAIDPIMGEVMEVRQWYKEMMSMSTDGKLRLYISEAAKFHAAPSRYDENEFRAPFYNNYFTDLMNWFERNDVSNQLNL